MELIAVEKTNGYESPTLNNSYVLVFEAEVAFLKDCKWPGVLLEEDRHLGFASTVTDPLSRQRPEFWRPFVDGHADSEMQFLEGSRVGFFGELTFLRTEQGFRLASDIVVTRELERIPGEIERRAAVYFEETKVDTLGSLQALKTELDDAREQLASLRNERDQFEAASGKGTRERLAELETAIAQQTEHIKADSETLTTGIVDFINRDPPIEGEPLSETQKVAIGLKSSEDMIVAHEHIEKGGDYRRAIEIYRQALLTDPDNDELKQALARATADRYMSAERFSQVRQGMTQDEVRRRLSLPFHRNIREYPERGVIAWFYPTSEAGDAAAIWFRRDDSGEPRVYTLKFDAIDQ